jgi:hypothetical protein
MLEWRYNSTFLKLFIRWMWLVTFTLKETACLAHWVGEMGVSQSRSERSGGEITSSSLSGIEPDSSAIQLRSLSLRWGLISVWLHKEINKLRDWKNIFIHIPPWAPHTYDFVVLTSLTHPRKILLFVLQIWKIGKAKDLSAPLRIDTELLRLRLQMMETRYIHILIHSDWRVEKHLPPEFTRWGKAFIVLDMGARGGGGRFLHAE